MLSNGSRHEQSRHDSRRSVETTCWSTSACVMPCSEQIPRHVVLPESVTFQSAKSIHGRAMHCSSLPSKYSFRFLERGWLLLSFSIWLLLALLKTCTTITQTKYTAAYHEKHAVCCLKEILESLRHRGNIANEEGLPVQHKSKVLEDNVSAVRFHRKVVCSNRL
jgi:hypothetical protein